MSRESSVERAATGFLILIVIIATLEFVRPAWALTVDTRPSVAAVVQQAHAQALARGQRASESGAASLQDFGAIGDGKTNDGPAFRRALASGKPLRIAAGTYLVDPDPASVLDDRGVKRFGWSLRIPSNATLLFEPGALIRQAPGAQSWTRTVSFQGANNVVVLGTLSVDANVAQRGPETNEHMHGVFFFDTRSTYVDAISSIDSRGDNVFIGGTGERIYGRDLVIGRINASTAGRKNLVLHFSDVTIGTAELDNRRGGASLFQGKPDSTDRHSIDVEPDDFRGERKFVQRLGKVITRGSGNDFTAGTAPEQADNFVVEFDDLTSLISAAGPSVYAWEQNGVTIKCGRLSITGIDGPDPAVKLSYAARLSADDLNIAGRSATRGGFLVQIAVSGDDRMVPQVRATNMKVLNDRGNGIDARTSSIDVETLEIQSEGTALRVAENVRKQEDVQPKRIGHLTTRDSGSDAVVAISTFSGLVPEITIGQHSVADRRPRRAATVYSIYPGMAKGLHVGAIHNPDGLGEFDSPDASREVLRSR